MIHQHGLNRSIITHLRAKFTDVQVDLKFDGYVMPETRPLIIVEPMQNNNEILVKQREAIETIYRYQVGLYDKNSVNLSINQDRLQDVFNFDKFVFYDTLQSPSIPAGYFYCVLKAVVPLPNEDLTKKTNNHRVFFDIEIQTNKYKGAI